MFEGRKRGVIFDVGHGGGSFAWRVAVPMIKEGFLPDSISTDLHIGSMNAGMKDMLERDEQVPGAGPAAATSDRASTWNPARAIKQDALGHLSVGATADVAVLRLEKGDFGFLDMYGARLEGTQRLVCEMTLRDGKIVYDLNGLSQARLDHAASGLQEHRRSHVGRDEEVTWPSRTRRRVEPPKIPEGGARRGSRRRGGAAGLAARRRARRPRR